MISACERARVVSTSAQCPQPDETSPLVTSPPSMFLAPALLTALAASWIEAMGDHPKAQLHRLVARRFHGGHRHGSAM